MSSPVVYYRRSLMDPLELAALRAHFPAQDLVVGLTDALVIGRYSVLPFYEDIAREVAAQGSNLINSPRAHHYIASFAYYHDLDELTPRTWFQLADVPRSGGPFVVKGATNSRKYQWNTHMFAPTFADVMRIAGELMTDLHLASQPPIVREYVPLVTLETGVNGLPFANEWRVFYYKTTRLSAGYYWSEAEARGTLSAAGLAVADEAAARIAPHATFFAVDIAETVAGHWIVIEVNDGQMAGLSCNEPDAFYAALARAIAVEPNA